MTRHAHRITQYAAFLSAAFACLTTTGATLASAPSYHIYPVKVAPVATGTPNAAGTRASMSRGTPMTPQEAARFRALMKAVPHLNRLSDRAQVHAFVAYFVAKGFRSTAYAAKYSPAGRIETLEYHASRSSRSTNKVDVSIGKHHSSTAISMN